MMKYNFSFSPKGRDKHLHFVHGVQIEGFSNSHYECTVCQKTFKDEILYKNHIYIHREKNIPCPHCDFSTNFKEKLKKHIGLKHSPGKYNRPWTCTICSFATNLKWTLKAHFMNIHKLTKQEADQIAEEVRRKFIEQNGEEPIAVPKG